jgi:hypothetical protein
VRADRGGVRLGATASLDRHGIAGAALRLSLLRARASAADARRRVARGGARKLDAYS